MDPKRNPYGPVFALLFLIIGIAFSLIYKIPLLAAIFFILLGIYLNALVRH